MEIIPAIDIIDGKCVRLKKGDYSEKTVYSDDPVEIARRFEDMGVSRLHLVDLDGAKAQHVVNISVLEQITDKTNLVVDFGGGVKSDLDIQKVFDAGASMITGGSVAVKSPEIMNNWISKYGPDRIILGVDVLDGNVMISGWQEGGSISWQSFLKGYMEQGIRKVISTDISKDGMLAGPSFQLYDEMLELYPHLQLIASGGVSSDDDVVELKNRGLYGTIIGKAYYEGMVNLEKLVSLC